jgi:hypothetical protein
MTSNIGSKVIEKGGGGFGFEFANDDKNEHSTTVFATWSMKN